MNEYINLTFTAKSCGANMRYETQGSKFSVEGGDMPFEQQAELFNTAKNAGREIYADIMSILSALPKGMRLTIYAEGGDFAEYDLFNRSNQRDDKGNVRRDTSKVSETQSHVEV